MLSVNVLGRCPLNLRSVTFYLEVPLFIMLDVNKNTVCWLLTSRTAGQELLLCVEMQLLELLLFSEISLVKRYTGIVGDTLI